mgnify:CR=1 FL=1
MPVVVLFLIFVATLSTFSTPFVDKLADFFVLKESFSTQSFAGILVSKFI